MEEIVDEWNLIRTIQYIHIIKKIYIRYRELPTLGTGIHYGSGHRI